MITTLLASVLLFAGGCSDNFDDSALWKGVDEIYNQLTELEKQADELNGQVRLLASASKAPTTSNTASPSPRRTT